MYSAFTHLALLQDSKLRKSDLLVGPRSGVLLPGQRIACRLRFRHPPQVRLSGKELSMMIRDAAAVSEGSEERGGVDQETFFALMGCSLWY